MSSTFFGRKYKFSILIPLNLTSRIAFLCKNLTTFPHLVASFITWWQEFCWFSIYEKLYNLEEEKVKKLPKNKNKIAVRQSNFYSHIKSELHLLEVFPPQWFSLYFAFPNNFMFILWIFFYYWIHSRQSMIIINKVMTCD